MPPRQTADSVLMVRPAAFGFNADTAQTNRLQRAHPVPAGAAARRALAEFDALAHALEGEGVRVCVTEDLALPAKPDAVFPNNWVSFHEDGTVVLYPLLAANRRLERREEIIEAVASRLGFRVRRRVDLTAHESAGRYLEGTGSLVIDHVNRLAYACLSPRTDAAVAQEWGAALGFEIVPFAAADAQGAAYYHTNVMLSLGSAFAVVCLEALATPDRERVLGKLLAGGREVIAIDRRAVTGFAANLLELASWDEALGDTRVLVMSAAARSVLQAADFARLAGCVDSVLAVPVPTIEALGGGSVRCMLAEVFLP
jgi:hypothetical protein